MNRFAASLLALPLGFGSLLAAHAQWTAPTPEELSMTAQPQVPGAAAVYLFRDETTDDHLHMFSIYVRLKVLTDRGKDYANVELPYATRDGAGYTVENIEGRTIHSDGVIIPFSGKPMQKVVDKSADVKVMTKVFTLPDVQVGSIIEYRYKLRGDDYIFQSPQWYIQSDLYTRKAHYLWRPTDQVLISNDDRGQLTNTIAWSPILPVGTAVKNIRLPATGVGNQGQEIIEVSVHDVPPAPQEEMMPPLHSFTYRVLFYYSPYRTGEEYWKNEGKHWAKMRDKFVGPGPGVSAAVQQLMSPGDTQDAKLKKFYAAIMALENTDFTREQSRAEEKAQGLSQMHTTDDVLQRKRGSSDQLAALFTAMARAAGMKAYLMAVTNRDRSLFNAGYLSMSQLNDDVVIVNVDGKERFFDPGARFCPYGHLAWKHTYTGGVRQIDGGSALSQTSGETYAFSSVQRVGNLSMDAQGVATGTVKIIYSGAPALRWRQESLRGGDAALHHDLQTAAEEMLPGGMEVTIDSIEKLQDYEVPLTVLLKVKGAIGSPTGKRLLIPEDLFEGNTRPLFSHEKRELPVYFEYGQVAQDALRINFPASFTVESLPHNETDKLKTSAAYDLSAESTPTSVTIRRNYSLGDIVFPVAEYAELRSFYTKMETKDQEPIVLTRSGGGGPAGVPTAAR